MLTRPERAPARTATTLIASQAAIWLAVALLLLIAPELLIAALFDAPLNSTGIVVARLFGAELCGLASCSWITRDDAISRHSHGLFASYCICNCLGFVITTAALAGGLMVGLSWIVMFLYLAYALAFAVLWIRTPARPAAADWPQPSR